jgi:hypothetical protein
VQRAFGKDGATRPILHRAEPACDVAAASAVSIASAARIFASKMMEAAELNRAEGSGDIGAKTQDFAMKLGDSVQTHDEMSLPETPEKTLQNAKSRTRSGRLHASRGHPGPTAEYRQQDCDTVWFYSFSHSFAA